MKKIIEIRKLYDYINDLNFGCVGVEENIKELKYYSFYNEQGEYNPNFLYEFDRKNPKLKVLAYHLANCEIQSSFLEEDIPDDLKDMIKETINTHQNYNTTNHFPMTYLDTNAYSLCVQELTEEELNGRTSRMKYNACANALFLKIKDWKQMSKEEKKEMKNTLLHELGHLKVTKKTLLTNDLMLVQCGLHKEKINLQPILLSNGSVFYKMKKTPMRIYDPDVVIEEIANDLDCRKVSQNFKGHYPLFGERLDSLCNQTLQMARYTEGIDTFNESLLTIINSKELLDDLKWMLYASVYQSNKWERQTYAEKANQLILKYEKEKQKNFSH